MHILFKVATCSENDVRNGTTCTSCRHNNYSYVRQSDTDHKYVFHWRCSLQTTLPAVHGLLELANTLFAWCVDCRACMYDTCVIDKGESDKSNNCRRNCSNHFYSMPSGVHHPYDDRTYKDPGGWCFPTPCPSPWAGGIWVGPPYFCMNTPYPQ